MNHFSELSWELSVLSRAVVYKNLSGASQHVGLSQPQLSRIIARIESSLDIILLDRTTKRNSAWTNDALKLAALQTKIAHQMDKELYKIMGHEEPSQLSIGCLEGLTAMALQFSHKLFIEGKCLRVELDVYDLDELEKLFMEEKLDFIFTIREPGRKKYSHSLMLGVQTLENKKSGEGDFEILSPFEYNTRSDKMVSRKVFISNSLEVRKQWFNQFGGKGMIPSDVRKQKSAQTGQLEVLLIGGDYLKKSFWAKITKFIS